MDAVALAAAIGGAVVGVADGCVTSGSGARLAGGLRNGARASGKGCGMVAGGYGEGVVGITRRTKRFATAALDETARRVERECGPPFEPLGATLKIQPVRISGLRSVAEGVSLYLHPHDVKTWEWWGDFEGPNSLEVRRRRRFSRGWCETHTLDEIEEWLRREAVAYLAELREKERSLADMQA